MNAMPPDASTFRRRFSPWVGGVVITVLFALVSLGLWRLSEDRIDSALEAEADRARDGFSLMVESAFNQMQALATIVAGEKSVQALFDLGAWNVAEEGGGPGGAKAAEARRLLLEAVRPQWSSMQRSLGARQLHFHLVDDGRVTSFLRVHTPSRFGDRLDSVRRIIADVAADGRPRAGFEVGRIYSGLRGVVPVILEEGGPGVAIGVLEAGTSFDAQLAALDRQFGGGVAVLLNRNVVDDVVWTDFQDLNGLRTDTDCACYVEASSRNDIIDWLREGLIQPLTGDGLESRRVYRGARMYNLVRFPLRDYAGTLDPALPAVGSVAVWIDRTALADKEHAALLAYGGVTLGAYALTLGLYLWGIAYARRRVELEQRLTKIAANLPGMVYQFQIDGDGASSVPYCSVGVARIFGLTPDQIRDDAAPLFMAIHPDDRAAVHQSVTDSRAAMRPWFSEHRVIHPDLGEIWVTGHAMPEALPDGGTMWHGFITDVTDRKQAEAALQESEERYRSVVAAMAEGILIRGRDGTFIDCNPAAESLLGQPRESLMGSQSITEACTTIRPDGSPYPGEDHPSAVCQRTGISVRGDIMGVRKADGSVTWLSINAEPLGWQAGQGAASASARAVVASFSDITARQTAEQELLRSNAELEQFAYVASHDLRQPLRMVASYLTLIERALDKTVDKDLQDFLGFAVDGARRMDRLIVDLLEYSRIGRVKQPRGPLALDGVVGEAIANLTVPIAEADAVVEVADDLPTVVGDHGEMVRLFQNLIGNAVKYAAPGRPAHIRVGWTMDPHGAGWVVSVSDNGTGIDSRHFDRIFGVFQRLVSRSEVEGTGIGLAVCRKITEHHGGRIWVDSVLGEGSTFNILLPKISLAPSQETAEGTAA